MAKARPSFCQHSNNIMTLATINRASLSIRSLPLLLLASLCCHFLFQMSFICKGRVTFQVLGTIKTKTTKRFLCLAKQQSRIWLSFSMLSSNENCASKSNDNTTDTKQPNMRDKFQGCLIGALAGDCLGSPFEGLSASCTDQKKVENIIGANSEKLRKKKDCHFKFTDDTAMTRSICKSLIENNGFCASDLASKFLEDFLREKNRGYGSGMFSIFEKWEENGTSKNPFIPAKEQFGGSGSYGNGAAMRVSPVALFAKTEEEVIELAKNTALLTHSNKHGINGAILQALSVHKALNCAGNIDKKQYLEELIQLMSDIEGIDSESIKDIIHCGSVQSSSKSEGRKSRREDFTFTSQLVLMNKLLSNESPKPDQCSIIEAFGNDISAQEAVVAALYSFLRNCDENFAETLIYAVSLGGDTDTIGSMACAVAGAYFGASSIPAEWKRVCEGVDDAINFADQLFDRMYNK